MIKNSTLTGYFGIVLAILGWGLSNSIIDFGLKSINPYFFLTLRFLLAMLLFFPYILVFKWQIFIKCFLNKWIWIIGFFEFLGLEFQYFGQQYVPAGLATLLSLQFILFVPLLSYKFLNEKLSRISLISIFIALSGTFLISTNGNFSNFFYNFNIGGFFLLLSAFSYSLYLIASSYFTKKSEQAIDSSVMFFSIILVISLFSFVPSIYFSSSFTVDSSVWIWVIALAIFSTLIPFFGYFEGLKVISANTMSLVLLLQILVPFAIDILFLGIIYSNFIIFGSFLIITSLLLSVSKPFFDRYYIDKKPLKKHSIS